MSTYGGCRGGEPQIFGHQVVTNFLTVSDARENPVTKLSYRLHGAYHLFL